MWYYNDYDSSESIDLNVSVWFVKLVQIPEEEQGQRKESWKSNRNRAELTRLIKDRCGRKATPTLSVTLPLWAAAVMTFFSTSVALWNIVWDINTMVMCHYRVFDAPKWPKIASWIHSLRTDIFGSLRIFWHLTLLKVTKFCRRRILIRFDEMCAMCLVLFSKP